jgi:hypothetical protein
LNGEGCKVPNKILFQLTVIVHQVFHFVMLPPAFNGLAGAGAGGEQMTDCGRLTVYSLCHSVNQCPTPVVRTSRPNHTLFFLTTATTDEKTRLIEQEGKSKQQRFQ